MTETNLPAPPAGPGGQGRARTVPLIVGLLLALLGLPLLIGGVGLGWALATQADDDGFFSTPSARFTTSTVALTSDVLQFGEAGADDRWANLNLATVRLRVTAGVGSEAFVGIAPTEDVRRYLGSTSYDEVKGIDTDPFGYSLIRRGTPGQLGDPPTKEAFWSASVSGQGTTELLWEIQPGSYTAVVMNADGTPGVDVDLVAAGRAGLLGPLALGLFLAGAVVILGSGLLIVYGARPTVGMSATGTAATRTAPIDMPATNMTATNMVPIDTAAANMAATGAAATPAALTARPPDSPVTIIGRQDPNLSRGLWLIKWFLVLPHWILLAVLWAVFAVLTVVAFFAILITGRYPRGIFDLNVGILRWNWRMQFYATAALGTDRYPPFMLGSADYPADLTIAYPQQLSRGLVLVKSWLLALPHLLILAVLVGTWRWDVGVADRSSLSIGGLVGALTLAAGLMLLFTGRYPASLFDLLMGLNRWVYRVIAYVALMTDSYPPFRLDQGPTEQSESSPAAPYGGTAAPESDGTVNR